MPPLMADEDFNGRILRGLQRRLGNLDLVRAQEVGLMSADDVAILAWAAREGRIVLTHDVNTMTAAAYARVSAGETMAGVVVASQDLSIGNVIDEIVLIVECTEAAEWAGQVVFLPL